MKPHAPRVTGALVFTTATAAALIVAVTAGGAGAEPAAPSPQAAPGGVTYREAGRFTTAGKPRDLLLHPESKNLYVGSDDLADTADVNEGGLYVLNPADGSTAAPGAVVGGTGGKPPAAGAAPAPAPHGSLASTGTTVLSLAGTAAALTLAGWALIRFRGGRPGRTGPG
ncbi:hypothetical protein [Streptomyces goshikiensis]|uniref:hypothetical protein n=1 Tax=Streptomyces goshikiensis TaxID=1942 RepID=UPI003807353E